MKTLKKNVLHLYLSEKEREFLREKMKGIGAKTFTQLMRKRLGLGKNKKEKEKWHKKFS